MRYLSGTKFGAYKLTFVTIYKTLIRSKHPSAFAHKPETDLLRLELKWIIGEAVHNHSRH